MTTTAPGPGSSASGASLLPDTTDLFTGGALVVIAILMALAIAGIIFGMRLAARRRQGEREIAAHNAEIEAQPPAPSASAAPASRVEREDRTPVETSPIADRPVVATPRRDTPADEPVAPATAPPVAPAAPTGPSPADGPITQLKGLGPKVAAQLAGHGITTVGQLAALTDDEAQALDARMGPFTGRMGRDRWQEQARFLAAGDRAGFEAVFGRL